MMHPCRNIFKRPFFAIKLFKKCDWISQVCFYIVFVTDFFTFLRSFTPFTSFPPKILVQPMSLWVMWPETGEHWWDAFSSAAQRSAALESANSLVCVLNQLSQLRGDTHVHHSSSHAQQQHGEERNKSHCHKHNYTKLWSCTGQEGKATMQTTTKKAFLRKGSVAWTNSYQIVGGKTEMWLERLSVTGRAGGREKKAQTETRTQEMCIESLNNRNQWESTKRLVR